MERYLKKNKQNNVEVNKLFNLLTTVVAVDRDNNLLVGSLSLFPTRVLMAPFWLLVCSRDPKYGL